MKKIRMQAIVLCLLIGIILPSTIFAVSPVNDPKDMIPPPPGTAAMVMYFDRITGSDAYKNGHKVSSDSNLDIDVMLLRFSKYLDVKGMTFMAAFTLPYAKLSLDNVGPSKEQISTSEIGDPTFCFVLWPYNNPSTKTWLATRLDIVPPLGEYTSGKPEALQAASNRWSTRPEITFIKGFGKFTWEISGAVALYTDNDRYGEDDLTSKKDPLWHAETHLSYDVSDKGFVALDYFYDYGSETKVEYDWGNVRQQNDMNDHTIGFTVGYMITPNVQAMFKIRDTLYTENGIKTTDIGFRFAYMF